MLGNAPTGLLAREHPSVAHDAAGPGGMVADLLMLGHADATFAASEGRHDPRQKQADLTLHGTKALENCLKLGSLATWGGS